MTRAEKSIDRVLNLIADRLGLDHDQVLFGRGAIPLLSHYIDRRGSALRNSKEQDRLLFWYLEAAIRGRYSGSTETSLDRDLSMVAEMEGGLDRLVSELSLTYGNLRILPEHFSGWSLGARFYPVLYMLTRVVGARDWGSGVALKRGLIGKMASLEVHHIFPKARLYASGKKYTRPEVNAVANFCFLTKDSNLTISDRHPEEYLAEVEKNYPGALASQWIPMDSKLWRIENYRDFLEERKRLLADAANHLIEELYHAPLPQHVGAAQGPIISPATTTVPGSILDPEEEAVLEAVNEWVVARGLPYGSLSYELGDQETGIPVAVLDLAWPSGLQQGLSRPVALLMNESAETVLAVKSRDFLVFTSSDQLKSYVEREVLAG